ncbi:MAG: TRAP transporter large permease [Synergistaceae bacterium]|jgi:C4-dicarboxylate transporter DctM subunit|nr:TRAP transporter large permease [Synergistaceae bacterium]
MLQAALVFALLLLFIFLGFPIYVSTIITAILFIVAMDIPFTLVIIKMFGSIDSFSLMAIPFFIIAGNIMTGSRITDKLVNFANAAVGQFKGGLGHVNILASMLFGGIQGSGAADASAIGGMLIPAMEKQGYEKDYAVAVTAGSSMLSPIIPPSIAMILYSFYTETPVSRLFLGGVIPGVMIGVLQMVVNAVAYRRRGYSFETEKFSWKNLWRAFVSSFGALIMPLIIVCGIVFGLVTPTESGVIAIAYGLVYGFFISKELRMKDLPKILLDSAVTTAVVMMTISAAGVLSNVLVRMRFQNEVLNFAVHTLKNPYLATLFLMAVLLVLGCFLDPTILIAMFATSILSIGNALGFDPIHYGVLMVIVMQVGAITPPVGTFLFISCGIARLPLEESIGALLPYIGVILLVILAMIFFPQIVTFLPSMV